MYIITRIQGGVNIATIIWVFQKIMVGIAVAFYTVKSQPALIPSYNIQIQLPLNVELNVVDKNYIIALKSF